MDKNLNELSRTNSFRELYDAIIYPPLEKVPLRYCIVRRNEWMVKNVDYAICYVQYTFGGAYKTLEYAKNKIEIINVCKYTNNFH